MRNLSRFFRGRTGLQYAPKFRGLTVVAGLLLVVALLFTPSPAESAGKGGNTLDESFESSTRAEAPGADYLLEALGSDEQGGPKITLKELSNGKELLLLHFWATWCAPCKKELPSLVRFNKMYGPKGVRVVAIALDSRQKVLKYLEKNGIELPVYLDQYGKVMRAYGIGALPVTVLVDSDFRVAGRYVGARDWNSPSERTLIDSLIKKE